MYAKPTQRVFSPLSQVAPEELLISNVETLNTGLGSLTILLLFCQFYDLQQKHKQPTIFKPDTIFFFI